MYYKTYTTRANIKTISKKENELPCETSRVFYEYEITLDQFSYVIIILYFDILTIFEVGVTNIRASPSLSQLKTSVKKQSK